MGFDNVGIYSRETMSKNEKHWFKIHVSIVLTYDISIASSGPKIN